MQIGGKYKHDMSKHDWLVMLKIGACDTVGIFKIQFHVQ